MKKLFFIISFLFSSIVGAQEISGVVNFKEKEAKGVLFIFAKKFDGSMPMPLAVKRIQNPKFPLTFKLSQSDAMIKSVPFEGPFKVVARLTKSGDAMDKSGPQGQTTKAINLGEKKILILLK